MKHITALIIENFQSHARSEFRFSPGLNVINGPSDSGKSATIRALRWALYNEPRGTEHVRHGANACRVHVIFSDGVEILREAHLTARTTRHRYIVRVPGEQEQVFEGFGADVPPDVVRAHGMPQVYLDKDRGVALNLGAQLEGPFLLSDTGTNRARAIGRILGVHVVDAAIRSSVRDLKETRREQGRLEREVEEYEQQLAAYEDLPAQEEALALAEQKLAQAEEAERRRERLASLQADLTDRERTIQSTEAALSALAGLPQAEALLAQAALAAEQERQVSRMAAQWRQSSEELGRVRAIVDASVAVAIAEERMAVIEERRQRLTRLEELARGYRQATAGLREVEGALTQMAAVPQVEEAVTDAASKQQRLHHLTELREQLVDRDARLAKGSQMVAELERDLQNSLREYGALLQRIGRCPTCGSQVDAAHIEAILAELAGGGDH